MVSGAVVGEMGLCLLYVILLDTAFSFSGVGEYLSLIFYDNLFFHN